MTRRRGRGHRTAPRAPELPEANGRHHDRTEAEVEERAAVVGGLERDHVGGPDPGHDLAAAHQRRARPESVGVNGAVEWPGAWRRADCCSTSSSPDAVVELQDHRRDAAPQELADLRSSDRSSGHRVVGTRMVGRNARQQLFELAAARPARPAQPAVIGEQSGHAHQRHRDDRARIICTAIRLSTAGSVREGPVTRRWPRTLAIAASSEQRGAHAADAETHRRPAEHAGTASTIGVEGSDPGRLSRTARRRRTPPRPSRRQRRRQARSPPTTRSARAVRCRLNEPARPPPAEDDRRHDAQLGQDVGEDRARARRSSTARGAAR